MQGFDENSAEIDSPCVEPEYLMDNIRYRRPIAEFRAGLSSHYHTSIASPLVFAAFCKKMEEPIGLEKCASPLRLLRCYCPPLSMRCSTVRERSHCQQNFHHKSRRVRCLPLFSQISSPRRDYFDLHQAHEQLLTSSYQFSTWFTAGVRKPSQFWRSNSTSLPATFPARLQLENYSSRQGPLRTNDPKRVLNFDGHFWSPIS